ncbi:MAG: DUF4177 domain-containing protein [Beijerinckiaceae bacterium]
MAYEYKCVSGPTIVAVKNAKVRDQAVKAFEDIMNAQAADGWEYVGIDEFHVSEPEGMFTRKRVYVPAKILVFRRLKAGSALAEALKANVAKSETAVAPAASEPLLIAMDMQAEKTLPSIKTIVAKVTAEKNIS